MKRLTLLWTCALVFLPGIAAAADKTPDKGAAAETYDQNTVLKETTEFFGDAAESVAKVVAKVFDDLGAPNGYIKGNEASGAVVVGVRYGDGQLALKKGGSRTVHWSGPSIGFDAGGNVSKTFVLVYHLPNLDALFKRFPAVDGSLYIVGGVSANYHQRDGIILVPIRLGAGLRSGVNIGYMHYTKNKTWNPF